MKKGLAAAGMTCILLAAVFLGGMEFRRWEESLPAGGGDAALEEREEIKQVALTFDDGPSGACTEALLDGLRERNVKATFFVIGMYAEQYPDIIRRMAQEGHVIGNHTYHHVQLSRLSDQQAQEELEMTNELIEDITGQQPIFARPPFGSWNKKKEFPADLIPVLWNVDPLDWKTYQTDTVVSRIMNNVEDGDIILLHDSYPTSVEAALRTIDMLQEEGYVFVTVDELMFG